MICYELAVNHSHSIIYDTHNQLTDNNFLQPDFHRTVLYTVTGNQCHDFCFFSESYCCSQDILVGLQMCAGGSEYLVPGRYNFRKPLSNAALNSLIDRTVKIINEDGEHIQDFTVHDMRRTASTLLHEAGYPSDWIEKALAHEQKGVRAVYNKAEYARQRAYMLQQWADMIDSWINGEHTDLIPFSPSKFEKWMAGE
jgi:hypothetical protein